MYLFNDITLQQELKLELDSWLHTPYRHHCGVKNLGCDCLHLVIRVLENLKIWSDIKIPDYSTDWHLHKTKELLRDGVLKYAKTELVSLSKFLNGDLILLHYGKASSHIGIFYDSYLYQALNAVGVCKINMKDRMITKRLSFAYRLLT